jgi:A/G-specific adenine glycosylase
LTHDTSFSSALLDWFDQYGRKHLPWQQHPTPYSVWVSEIMLQQTQVATVIPYYQRFMQRFADVQALALAPIDEVLHLWTGLGYYARGRNLHQTAQIVVQQHGGQFPRNVDALAELPGIGRSTAGAILALGYRQRAVILDGNVKRVLTRVHCVEGWPDQPKVQKELWELAEKYTPEVRCADYTQAIMDLGATLCARSKPACGLCPLQTRCEAKRQQRTSEFPSRKPTKALPVKTTFMLMYFDQAQRRVLLEKRPSQGIWGGLWSFPETAALDSHAPELTLDALRDARSPQLWNSVRHTFSHFHLDITPVLLPLESTDVRVMEADRFHWYPVHEPSAVGLAAPVKKLLELLAHEMPAHAR